MVDIPHRQTHIFIDPSADGCQARASGGEDETVAALRIPGLELLVAEAL